MSGEPKMREVWEPTRHRINDVIRLHDEAGVVVVKRPSNWIRVPSEYFIGQVEVSWNWEAGHSEPDAPIITLRTAHARDQTCDGPVRLDGGYLFPDQLREEPAWLTDIIERSRPRLP